MLVYEDKLNVLSLVCLKYFYGVYCKKKKIIQKGEFIK